MHPDLTTDPKKKKRRQQIMAEMNNAYAEGNEERLRQILAEWESSQDSIEGEGIGAELIRIIRKIEQVRIRFEAIRKETEELKKSDMYELKVKADEAEKEGNNLLSEMAQYVTERISETTKTLENLFNTI